MSWQDSRPGDSVDPLVSRSVVQPVRFAGPVVKTPAVFVIVVWVWRLIAGVVGAVVLHPVATGLLAVVVAVGVVVDPWWLSLVGAGLVPVVLVVWWWLWRASFLRLAGWRLLALWRRFWVYRRHWQPVMVVAGLAEFYQDRQYLPRLGRVRCTPHVDRVSVRMLKGTSPQAWEKRVLALAHGFDAPSCRVVVDGPRRLVVEFPRGDSLSGVIPALPVPEAVDLAALPMGRAEDGSWWRMRLHGTHILVAGVTGAGKGSVIWSAIRAMLPAIRAGVAEVWAVDPKRMELSLGRRLFARYADTAETAVGLLEDAVVQMQERAGRYAGKVRKHTPTTDDPFVAVVVDEVAFLTAYHPDRDVRRRAENALATLTSQGRAVGFSVLAALQDPRKEVMNLRNLFPDKIALRLDEPSQVDMILGEGARERGGNAHLISADPAMGAGVGFVRLETSPYPLRVRASFVTDSDITRMETDYGRGSSLRSLPAESGADDLFGGDAA
ncbi:FtsK/SpoIIIE domain-containing protein [Allonocardiopsis opalescens]|uniref:S-DNA-T family DNA segregation ATPase FtsK/SpoIIIE n=1 Tax=Allonocardiopsis opalescens TaxID=1144618 RepID=A0A2T0PTS9_9ACTN|nr:FtsK/SpoIIIE domain-containing protein [Allonocardiopsis opalescens]PRX92126.1 S-DNA-T family DNA segregation ATPase FtsK/SpoIIIE [Allonocardiopsis opalescens]